MYLKVTMAITGILLLLIAGCPKDQSGDSGNSGRQAEEVAAKLGEGNVEAKVNEPTKSSELGAEFKLTAEEEQTVRDALLAAAENLKMTYDAETDSLKGDNLPQTGTDIPALIERTARVLKTSNIEIEPRTITKVAQSMVADLILPPPGMEPPDRKDDSADGSQPPDTGRQKSELAAGSQQIDRTKLKIAKQLIGDWKSTKEIHTRFTAQHSPDYFEFVNISPENKIMFKRYREGELISDRLFDFTFDENRGELKLRDDKGEVVNSLIAYNMGDDDTTLYLEFKSGTITVYEQVSRVGVPLTEEQKAGVAQPGIGDK